MLDKLKDFLVTNKLIIVSFFIFFVIVTFIVFRASYAYFFNNNSFSIINSEVGDFDNDISVVIYEQIENNYYKKVDTIPVGYTLNRVDCGNVICGKNTGLSCQYSFNNGSISITSSEKVKCSFFFNNN